MFCPKCGAANDENSKFCLGCGGPLASAAPVTPPAPPAAPLYSAPPQYQPPQGSPPKKGHAGIIIVVLLLVLAIAAAGIWFFFLRDDGKDGKETTKQSISTTTSANTKEDTTKPDSEEATTKPVSEENTTYMAGSAWPTSGLYTKLPTPDFGSVLTQMTSESDGTAYAMLQGVNQANFDSYVSDLKAAGFDKDITSGILPVLGQYFNAVNDSGENIITYFLPEASTMTISLDVTP